MARKTDKARFELMRNVNGRLYELRRHENGRWYLHYTKPGGRTERISTRTKNVAQAKLFLKQFCDIEENGPDIIAETEVPSIGELLIAKYGDPDAADRKTAVTCAVEHLLEAFDDMHPGDLRQEHIDNYIEDRIDGTIGRPAVSPSTHRNETSRLLTAINHGIKKRKVPAEFQPTGFDLPDPSPARERHLTDEELTRVFDEAERSRPDPDRMWRNEKFLWIARYTAARRTAIQDLTWRQVDWEAGVIHFLPEGEVQTSKKRASVPISPKLMPALIRMYEEREDEFVIGRGGEVNKTVKAIGRRVQVHGLTPHVLRHTAATKMAREGAHIWLIAHVLGNSQKEVEKTYAKFQPGYAAGAVALL